MSMGAIAAALLYVFFAWWFSTGLVLFLVLRRPGARRVAFAVAAVLFPACLVVLAKAGSGMLGTYAAFTAALLLWGILEMAFLSGAVTGPSAAPCPADARGFSRFRRAVGAILYHELALAVTGGLVVIVTLRAGNPFGLLTFAVLWVMRLSAKLNLYFGVPVLNDENLPAPVAHLRTYFRRAPASPFFPVSVLGAVLLASVFVAHAWAPATAAATQAGHALEAGLIGLAILEHAFMIVPLPVERLWSWSTRSMRRPGRAAGLLEKAVATRP